VEVEVLGGNAGRGARGRDKGGGDGVLGCLEVRLRVHYGDNVRMFNAMGGKSYMVVAGGSKGLYWELPRVSKKA
jgi:hypothetical protein